LLHKVFPLFARSIDKSSTGLCMKSVENRLFAVLGASSVAQLEQNLGALDNLEFSDDQLTAIDSHAVDAGIDLWEHFRCGTTA